MLLLLDVCLNFPRLSVCVLHRCDALSGAGQTNPAVASQGHGVGVRRVDLGQTVGKCDGDEARQVVGADSLVGLNERGLQDGLLQNRSQEKTLARSDESGLRWDKKLATLGHFLFGRRCRCF